MFLHANLHSFTNLFVRETERDSALRKIRSRSPGVHKSGMGCALHGFVIQLDSLHPCGYERKQSKNSVGGVEQRFLGFLEVFVVGQWQSLQTNLQCGSGSNDASGFTAG